MFRIGFRRVNYTLEIQVNDERVQLAAYFSATNYGIIMFMFSLSFRRVVAYFFQYFPFHSKHLVGKRFQFSTPTVAGSVFRSFASIHDLFSYAAENRYEMQNNQRTVIFNKIPFFLWG